jgi:CRISPR-associated exonuclease Cas4
MGAFRARRLRRTFGPTRNNFRLCSRSPSPRTRVSILRIVTGLLVFLALFAFCGWLYFTRRSSTGLPAGLLVYDDAGRQHLQRPLVSHRLCLSGRSDYLIETAAGLVPVELKSGACPRSGPHAAHVAQLMTYCVLVEDTLARPVPYGVLRYSDAERQIPFTPDRKREVLQLADEIRRKRGSANVHRQHQQIGRCRKCGYRSVCEEVLS